MNEIIIDSAATFHEQAFNLKSDYPIFRGVSDTSYELITRFGRSIIQTMKFREMDNSFKYIVSTDIEKPALKQFINLSIPYLGFEPVNEWEWLAIAQHHGVSTRMMDWTTNPLVAAYFAIEYNRSALVDSAIYVIKDHHEIVKASLDQSPFEIKIPSIFHPRHSTPRITAQSGLFTVHPEPTKPFDIEG
jgi:hypothetical protein